MITLHDFLFVFVGNHNKFGIGLVQKVDMNIFNRFTRRISMGYVSLSVDRVPLAATLIVSVADEEMLIVAVADEGMLCCCC